MSLADLAQNGVLTDPMPHAEFMTFVVRPHDVRAEAVADALGRIANVEKSIRQKDGTAGLTITTGFSATAWPLLFPEAPMPKELHAFIERRDGDRHFPSTPGDIFCMVKSRRLDLNFQAAKWLAIAFAPIADLVDDTRAFGYLDGRDLIDFVDGTENPTGELRAAAVLVDALEPEHRGGSYLVVQRYADRQAQWDALTTEEQEGVIGRTKMDDLEFADDAKKPFAHNVKAKVEIDGVERKMYRQNRAFGNAIEHGTMFVGFAASASVIETSLEQMITADAAGNYDKLLDFVDPQTGTNYFVPAAAFLDEFG